MEVTKRCSHTVQRRDGKDGERPTLAPSQTDTNRQLQSEDCCLFGEKKGEGGGAWIEDGGKREKIYLICNCQESIFTCKRASEWERLPRGRNMTAFTRVRMDHHHLQPPPPLCLSPSITLSLSRPCSVFLPLSFLPFFPLLCLTPLTLILFSDSITLHFDNTAA